MVAGLLKKKVTLFLIWQNFYFHYKKVNSETSELVVREKQDDC